MQHDLVQSRIESGLDKEGLRKREKMSGNGYIKKRKYSVEKKEVEEEEGKRLREPK